MRYIFMGTPGFARIILQDMIDAGRPPVGVMTQVDQPAGRGRKLFPPPVKQIALDYGLPILQPAKIGDGTRAWMKELAPDICVVAAFGKILTRKTLDLAPFGCINAHGSLLPKYRGAAPINWALINGDEKSGVTIMHVSLGQDEGDIIFKQEVTIEPDDIVSTLGMKIAHLSGPLLIKAMDALENGTAPRIRQSDLVQAPTFAPKLKKCDGRFEWDWPAKKIARLIHGTNPWPVAYTCIQERTLKIYEAQVVEEKGEPGEIITINKKGMVIATGEGALQLGKVQLEGKNIIDSYDCSCGLRLKAGEKVNQ